MNKSIRQKGENGMKPTDNCPFCQWLKQIDDEHICGKTTYQFDELNFCPVCGKNLKEA